MKELDHEQFDLKLASECAKAFSSSAGVGCTVSDCLGHELADFGRSCSACRVCSAVGRTREACIQAHIYGMTEAERFGGKYIYFCPMGFTCFVSPILGSAGSEAKITVGPLLMVDRQDYIDCELSPEKFSDSARAAVVELLPDIPYFPPEKVNDLSTLLFMAVGFLNNVSRTNRMIDKQKSGDLQAGVAEYISELKAGAEPPTYSLELERSLISAVSHGDTANACRLLNELLTHMMYSEGGELARIKTRSGELLGLLSRGAVNSGASAKYVLSADHGYMQMIMGAPSFGKLCSVLSEAVTELSEYVSDFIDARHTSIIHRTLQHLQVHYAENITLERMAGMLYLSPPYFSRLFSREVGTPFNAYLNSLRIRKAQELMRHKSLRLTDIALMAGFHDQSYFTKVFKRETGIAPLKYREELNK